MAFKVQRGKDREIIPPGAHYAVCYGVVDLGTQSSKFGAKPQAYIRWELPVEAVNGGKPPTIGKFYTVTDDPRGNLRQDLESWMGRTFTTDEFCALDLEDLIGRTCTLGVANSAATDGRMRATITSIMLPNRGMPERAQPLTAPMSFTFDGAFNKQAYNDLPPWLRDIVARSPEYRKATEPELAQGTTADRMRQRLGTDPQAASEGGVTRLSGKPGVDDDLDDAIPF
jgi:hypothetical protein